MAFTIWAPMPGNGWTLRRGMSASRAVGPGGMARRKCAETIAPASPQKPQLSISGFGVRKIGRRSAVRALVNAGGRRVALLPALSTTFGTGLAEVEFHLWVGIVSQLPTVAVERKTWRQATVAVA